MYQKYISLVLLFIGVTFIWGCSSSNLEENHNQTPLIEEGEFVVTVLDVGKADAIIIQDSESVIMIDTAEDENYDDIRDFLEESKIENIDYLIITHFDKDHVGGASQLIDDYQVEQVIEPNYEKDSKHMERYQASLFNKGIEPLTLTEDTTLSFQAFELNLYPSKIIYEDDNNNSIICSLSAKEYDLLFMGDAQKKRTEEFLDFNENTYDLIKMPHHGNFNSMTKALITETKPSQAIITCSKKYPADNKTLDVLEAHDVETFQTINGDYTFNYSD